MAMVSVYIGDVRRALKLIPDESVDCVITSPPYWKQRDYKHPEQIGQESSHLEYIEKLVEVFTEVKRVLKPTGTMFLNIGYKYINKELLLIPEMLALELQKNGWALINKIIWHKPNAMPSAVKNRFSNLYEPVFLFVKKESKFNYYFSIDELRIPTPNDYKLPEDIVGYKVVNSLAKQKEIGEIVRVYKNRQGILFAEVLWNSGKTTLELVQELNGLSQQPVELICTCGKKIKHEVDSILHYSCNGFPYPVLPEVPDATSLEELEMRGNKKRTSYSGKYKLSPENRGASPGARKSLFGEYFVLKRRYNVFQPIIAKYLKFWREKRGITVKEIDKLLGYKDTAGHWFRKDTGEWGKGGSIPLPQDWWKLKEILGFDDLYDRYVTESHLVFQTVKPHPRGKNPGDLWSIRTNPSSIAHFAMFPEELVRYCILAGSPEGGIILDPFAGSGTVGKVAQMLGRSAILIELVPEYLDIIKERCHVKEVINVE